MNLVDTYVYKPISKIFKPFTNGIGEHGYCLVILVLLMRLNLLSDVSEVKPSQLGFLFVSRVFVSFYHLPFRGSWFRGS